VRKASYNLSSFCLESYAGFAAKYTNNNSLDEFMKQYIGVDYLIIKVFSTSLPVVGSIPKILNSVLCERYDRGKWTVLLMNNLGDVNARLGKDFSEFTKNFVGMRLMKNSSSVSRGSYT